MDIANRIGLGSTQSRIQINPAFAVAIVGLSDTATHGLCATRGVELTAQVTGLPEGVPAGTAYQWHVQGSGPIAGATQAAYLPDTPLVDQSAIFCAVDVPGLGSRASSAAIYRQIVPQVQGSLFDEVFDLDIGPQMVATAAVFSGENLSFAVTGAGAGIDTVTGEVSVPTDVEMDGAIIEVIATNSGGSATAAFQVTIEDISLEGALPFGALTPAGAGGIAVPGSAITQGDPAGHWTITGGFLVPSSAGEGALSGVYALVFDSSDTLDVMIEPDKASARVDEIATVFDTLPASARGLMVQDGDARPLGRIRLAPRVFDQQMVLEPTNWLEDADPRASLRPVTLGGLTIGGDPSGDRVLRMENLMVQGFVCQLEQGSGESEFNNGIILVERPSRHVVIRQNDIWSRDLAEIVAADDFRNNLGTSRQMRGIFTGKYSGRNEHISIEDNHIHDVSRGLNMVVVDSYEGQRSRLCGNIIEDCYTNFFTCGNIDGLDIFDNRCMGVYAANGDTTGAIPATSPHSAAGGSFDAGASKRTQNITMIGNLFHTGWKRTKLHADLGLPKPEIGATGIKFNDPGVTDAYWNIVVGFNTVISHGICLELAGAGADTHIDVFNNTLASESYAGIGSGPVFYFLGAENARVFNNIGTDYTLGTNDGTGIHVATLDTLEGYGNLKINATPTGNFGENDYFAGDPVKGIDLLTIDEAQVAYTPKADTRALTAAQKKGAQGTGLYQGDGVHSVVYDKPTPSGGVAHSYSLATFNGTYLERGGISNLTGPVDAMTFAFQGQTDLSADGANRVLFSMAGQRLYIRKLADGTISFKAEDDTNNNFIEGEAYGLGMSSDQGLVSYVCSFDFQRGTMLFAANGELADWYSVSRLRRRSLSLDAYFPRIFANELTNATGRWWGQMGAFYLSDRFVDLETEAGLNSFFAADGGLVDLGVDGSAPTGEQPMIFIKGDQPTTNLGTGGQFTLKP